MKTDRDSQDSLTKRQAIRKFFSDLFCLCLAHVRLALSILWLCVGLAIILFIAELIVPKYVHLFNYSLTDTTFSQLVRNHRYHAAIALLEYKDSLVMNGSEFYKFRQELADCYIHTGDYPKALEQYAKLRGQLRRKTEEEGLDRSADKKQDMMMSMIDAVFAKEEFRIYLKMGDKANILKQYDIIRKKYASVDWEKLHEELSEMSDDFDEKFDGYDLKDGLKLELLQGEYILNPEVAIPKMEEYAIDVANSKKYNHAFKIKVFGELVRMLIEQGRAIAARHYLEFALKIVDSLDNATVIYPSLGELSDYCYQLNDISDGRRLLKKYLYHIDDTYDESDIDYAVAHIKEFKYLQADGRWDDLTDRLGSASRTLRNRIARNFTGMTSTQREYFIARFKPLFSYANDLLAEHNSEKLAEICFENNLFMRGLLLRSETSLANSIAAMGNRQLSEKYRIYIDLSHEFVARQYVSGPGNYLRKAQIGREIASLESDLASHSRDFRRDNEKSVIGIDELRHSLAANDMAMQIVESAGSYYALLLSNDGKVKYVPLGYKDIMHSSLASTSAVYVDASIHSGWLSTFRQLLEGRNVYYATDGIFNTVSLSSLPVDDNGKILGDIANFNLTSSLADIPDIKERESSLHFKSRSIVLWGGVDYGAMADCAFAETDKPSVILRGEKLCYLPGSKAEVTDIAEMLKRAGGRTIVLSGRSATEKSFVSRSHKKDYILHISTHGFFKDSGAFVNPMQNSGLLFAGSQDCWMNGTVTSNFAENDGILRADEISKLDFTGCRLVVLSACQTGLGQSDSEGVYGLQRAFRLAGVESILMSLWSVDDRATRRLMTYFYAELISGKTPAMALTNARTRMRREGCAPDQWAAFLLLN